MNLDQVVDYGAAWTFTDAFKASRDWFSLAYNTETDVESWSGGGTPVVDAEGWPVELKSWTDHGDVIQQRLGTLMFREIGGNYPAGVYHAQWRGTGTLSWGFDARVIASGTNQDGTHWADLNVTPTNEGMFLRITSMPPVDADPTDEIPPAVDPIRDIHVWMPDYNGQSFKGQVWEPGAGFSPFHPLFVERLEPFKTLRFMDWMKTNVSTNEQWAGRRGWDEANQTGEDGKGVALEYMVALANEIDADVWFNMPYKADDDFVRNFADHVREYLEPWLQINVEWSNEIWNSAGGFNTYGWITQQLALPENAGMTRYQLAAREIKRDFDIWSAEFALEPHRLMRVVAGQAANPTNVTQKILENMDGKFDAVSCTGYFGLNSGQRASFNSSTTGTQIAQAVLNNVPSALRGLQTHKNLGQQYGGGREIKIYAYESGQHADGQGNAGLSYLNALYAAQTDPLMYEAYDDFVRGFYDMSGDLAMHFTYVSRNDKNGSWGALQSQTQPTSGAPKYRALVEGVSGVGYYPEYTVTVDQAAGEEFGTAPMRFRVKRSGDKSLAQDVSFQLGGTAGPADYVSPGNAVHFAAGVAEVLLDIVPVDDGSIESAETVTLTLLAGAGYKLDGIASRNTATASIVDDDGYLNANLPIANPNFEAGDLTGWTKVPAANNLIGVAPPAPGGTLFNAPPQPAEGARWAWGAGATGNDGDGALTAGIAQTFSLASHAGGIDAGTARLVFSSWGTGFSNDFAQLELRYYNAAGTQLGATLKSNTANTDKQWTKMTADTAVPALARSVELRATMNRAGGSLSDAGVDALAARLTYPIVPVVTLTATDASAAEAGSNTGTFTVSRSGSTLGVPLTVNYAISGTATSGSDYAALQGSVTIPSGASSATFTVAPIDDILDEPEETVIATLVGGAQYAVGTSAAATATIADNDLPRVTVSLTDEFAAEAGQDTATFVIERLTEVLDQPLTVNYTLGGTASASDYQAMTGSVTIPAGESVAAVTLVPVNDTTVEHDETVTLNILSTTTYTVSPPASATATIVNDDHPRVAVVATDASAAELGSDPATFTFTRTGEFVNEILTVYFDTSGSAVAGTDYTLSASGVTIPAGSLTASVTITPVPDNFTEGNETVVLTLLPNGGYTPGSPASATATIADAVSTGNLPSWVAPGSVASWNQASKTLTVIGVARVIGDPGNMSTINVTGASAVLTIDPTSISAVRVGALNLSNGAVATIASVGAARTAVNHRVLVIESAAGFTVDPTSKLDIVDNDLIVDYTGASPAENIEAMVRSGFNVIGDWAGTGIISSAAAVDGNYTVAIADNAQLAAPFGSGQGGPLFAGENVDLTAVLVKFTHRVDIDLDGVLTPNDSAIVGGNFSEGEAANWVMGDVDYDALFTSTDAAIFGGFFDPSLPSA